MPAIVVLGALAALPLLKKLTTTRSVSFKAKKKTSVPVKVDFKTKTGDKISFNAHKTVKKTVPVSFRAKKKKK